MGHSYGGSRSISPAQGGLSHSESNLSRRVLRDIFHPLTVSSFSKSLPRSLLPQSQLPGGKGLCAELPHSHSIS